MRLRLEEGDIKTYEKAAARRGIAVNVPAKLWREYEAARERLLTLTEDMWEHYYPAEQAADDRAAAREKKRIARRLRKRGTITREELADGVAAGRYIVINQ